MQKFAAKPENIQKTKFPIVKTTFQGKDRQNYIDTI